MFFTEDEEECRYEVVRKAERKLIPRVISRAGTSQGYSYESLSFRKQNKKMEPFLLSVTERVAEENTYSHDGEEFLYVMKGNAELLLEDERIHAWRGRLRLFRFVSASSPPFKGWRRGQCSCCSYQVVSDTNQIVPNPTNGRVKRCPKQLSSHY